jgi:serine/threonine protein kinase
MASLQRYLRSDFSFVKIIGVGSYSTIYLVKHLESNKKYAIKSLSKSLIKTKNFEKSLIREKTVLSKLNHHNILKLYSSFQDDKFYCFFFILLCFINLLMLIDLLLELGKYDLSKLSNVFFFFFSFFYSAITIIFGII